LRFISGRRPVFLCGGFFVIRCDPVKPELPCFIRLFLSCGSGYGFLLLPGVIRSDPVIPITHFRAMIPGKKNPAEAGW
jgi:hypothetical protein